MQENEFEKQVRDTMDGFKVRPSEPVWPAIREEIKDKKRRRLLLLIPIFLGLITAGYFSWNLFYSAPKRKIITLNTESVNRVQQAQSIDSFNNIKAKSNSTSISGSAGDPLRTEPATAVNTPSDNSVRNSVHPKKVSNIAEHPSLKIQKSSKTVASKLAEPNGDWSHVAKQAKHDRHLLSAVSPPGSYQPSLEPTLATPDYSPVFPERSSGRRNLEKSGLVLLLPSKPSPVIIAKSHRIKWGIDLSAGASSRYERPFNFSTEEKATQLSNSFAGSPVNTGTTGGGLLVLPPSAIKVGAAFKIGVTLEKAISKRIGFSTGIQYAYSSDHITTGKSIYSVSSVTLQDRNYQANAVAQTSYSGVQPQNYTNKYHFIELPVTLHVNLTGKWKSPILWNAGAAVSRLISSNVLLYDETWGGVYYKGNDQLNKTQFSVTSGFAIRLTSGGRWEWRVGPQVSMNTTKLFQTSADKYNHLVYGSLNLKLLFPGKKSAN